MYSTSSDIHDLLTSETIRVGLEGSTKEEVINNLIDLLRGHPAIENLDAVRNSVFERERVMSTGVGKGLGLPHAKTGAISGTAAAFAVLAQPVDFRSIDNKPVQILFLLVGTEAAKSQHIRLLGRVSRLMNRDVFRDRLLRAESSKEVLDLFEEEESEMNER